MIYPFTAGDILLIQRLGRQATKLNTVHALLQPHSALWAALTAVLPWNEAKVATYVLHQRGNHLARAGFLQAQKRHGRPEADIILLAPALDTALGHPAVWEKLLSHYSNEAAQQQIARLYIDAPDQPLPVNTFSHVGFKVYTRQTIWRLMSYQGKWSAQWNKDAIRMPTKADEWALQRLYTRISPNHVQLAEGLQTDNAVRPPILDWWQTGLRNSFVFERNGEVQGYIRIAQGRRGVWLQLWADPHQTNTTCAQSLIACALTALQEDRIYLPVYIGVRDYHGAVGTLLSDFGFAPFTDRAKMVKHVVQWVRHSAPRLVPMLEGVREVVPTPFVFPEAPHRLSSMAYPWAHPQDALFSPEGGGSDDDRQKIAIIG